MIWEKRMLPHLFLLLLRKTSSVVGGVFYQFTRAQMISSWVMGE
jgi:hypothetical protein